MFEKFKNFYELISCEKIKEGIEKFIQNKKDFDKVIKFNDKKTYPYVTFTYFYLPFLIKHSFSYEENDLIEKLVEMDKRLDNCEYRKAFYILYLRKGKEFIEKMIERIKKGEKVEDVILLYKKKLNNWKTIEDFLHYKNTGVECFIKNEFENKKNYEKHYCTFLTEFDIRFKVSMYQTFKTHLFSSNDFTILYKVLYNMYKVFEPLNSEEIIALIYKKKYNPRIFIKNGLPHHFFLYMLYLLKEFN